MITRAQFESGPINPNGSVTPIQLASDEKLGHLSIFFDASDVDARESYVSVHHSGGGSPENFPQIFEVVKSHGGNKCEGAQISISEYSRWGKDFGYTINFPTAFNASTIELHNGSSHTFTKYRCLALKEE